MKKLILVSLITLAFNSFADVTESTQVDTSYILKRGTTTVVNTAGTNADCHARARADAQARGTTANYSCAPTNTFTVTFVVAPVQCPTMAPADQTRQTTCPAGTYGTFGQTSSYVLQPTPACWQPSGIWSPIAPPVGACSTTPPSGTYVTTFDTAETKLREGGKWSRANNAWTDMKVVNGVAFPNNGITNSYDDSYALLTQSFGNNYEIEGVVYRDPSLPADAANEISLLLRSSDDTSNIRTYEILWQAYGGQQIMRWNGPFGDVTALSVAEINYFNRPLKTGDVLKASAIGNTITMYVNGLATYRATDSTFTTGQPGIGGFLRPGYNTVGLGFTQITVTAK